jgi:hypothetical protein
MGNKLPPEKKNKIAAAILVLVCFENFPLIV